jgi:hypothetical protein
VLFVPVLSGDMGRRRKRERDEGEEGGSSELHDAGGIDEVGLMLGREEGGWFGGMISFGRPAGQVIYAFAA